MEAGKWTYIVDKLDRADGQKPAISQQFHLRPMNAVAAKDLAANGEYIYIDGMQIFSYEPTVATVTFKAENGTVLYAIDALNSEAVTYNGTVPTKTGYTFKGWALENTTEVVDTFTFDFNISIILLIIIVGIVHTGIAYALYFSTTAILDVQTLALYSYIDPIVAIVLSITLLQEAMRPLEIIGAILILGATIASDLNHKK